MKIILDTLSLENFKGVKKLNVDFEGQNCEISGDNAAGKTTIVDAIFWLLFNKDSNGRTDFEIKPLDLFGKQSHNLEHSVEASLKVYENGGMYCVTLSKTMKEKWVKPRGSTAKEFQGHVTKYTVDKAPKKLGEFKSIVSQFAKEDLFRLLTSPTYFSSLHWKKQREMVIDACGDITDEDVFATGDDTLTELKTLIGRRTMDGHRDMLRDSMKEINEKLTEIPVRIDQINKNMTVGEGLTEAGLTADIATLNGQITKHNQTIIDTQSGKGVVELNDRLARLDNERRLLQEDYTKELDNGIIALRESQKRDIERRNVLVEAEKNQNALIQQILAENSSDVDAIATLAESYRVVHASQYAPDRESCALCNQTLPIVENAEAEFNVNRAKELERILAEGKQRNADVKERCKRIDELKVAIPGAVQEMKDLNARISIADTAVNDLVDNAAPISEFRDYKAVTTQREETVIKINKIANDMQSVVDIEQEAVKNLETDRDKLGLLLAEVRSLSRFQEEIDKLEKDQADLSVQFEDAERQLNLMERFTRLKLSLLDDKIANKFSLVSFKLYEEQINGGLAETCEVVLGGVPFNSLNSGGRIQAGCDIINTLSKHNDKYLPLFVDNRESVTILPIPEPSPMQVVALRVVEDKALTVWPQGPQ